MDNKSAHDKMSIFNKISEMKVEYHQNITTSMVHHHTIFPSSYSNFVCLISV